MTRFRRVTALLAVSALTTLGLVSSGPASADGHSDNRGTQRFLVLSTSTAEDDAPIVIANGPIHAQGTDQVIDDNNDVFAFPDGSISVRHQVKSESESFDPVTCYGRFTERGTYRITGGTGEYEDARGRGTYTVVVRIVGCDENAPPTLFQLVIDARGSIRF